LTTSFSLASIKFILWTEHFSLLQLTFSLTAEEIILESTKISPKQTEFSLTPTSFSLWAVKIITTREKLSFERVGNSILATALSRWSFNPKRHQTKANREGISRHLF